MYGAVGKIMPGWDVMCGLDDGRYEVDGGCERGGKEGDGIERRFNNDGVGWLGWLGGLVGWGR